MGSRQRLLYKLLVMHADVLKSLLTNNNGSEDEDVFNGSWDQPRQRRRRPQFATLRSIGVPAVIILKPGMSKVAAIGSLYGFWKKRSRDNAVKSSKNILLGYCYITSALLSVAVWRPRSALSNSWSQISFFSFLACHIASRDCSSGDTKRLYVLKPGIIPNFQGRHPRSDWDRLAWCAPVMSSVEIVQLVIFCGHSAFPALFRMQPANAVPRHIRLSVARPWTYYRNSYRIY